MEESTTSLVVFCKNPDCAEELQRNKHSRYGKFCSDCGTPTGPAIVLECPNCGSSRNKRKKGTETIYANFCDECGHHYASVAAGVPYSSETVSEAAPEDATRVRTKGFPANDSETGPDDAPEAASDSAPEAIPDDAHEVALTGTPEAGPVTAYDNNPEDFSEALSKAASEGAPEPVAEATQSAMKHIQSATTHDVISNQFCKAQISLEKQNIQSTEEAEKLRYLLEREQSVGDKSDPLAGQESQELPLAFQELKVKVDEANQLATEKGKKLVKFSSQEVQQIKRAHKQFDDMNCNFDAAVKKHHRANKENKPGKEKKLIKKRKELKSFAERWQIDELLQSSIRGVEEYHTAAISQPQEALRNSCKRIVFLATLQTSTKQLLAPVVKVEGWIGDEWQVLAEMEEMDGILRGECSTIPKSSLELRYKYLVYSPKDNIIYTEKLYNHKESRYANFSKHGEDHTLYDGLITIYVPQSRIENLKSGLRIKNPYDEKLEGFRDMLPNWLTRIRHGESANDLKDQINQAMTQQVKHLSTFIAFTDATSDIRKKLRVYLDDARKEHIHLSNNADVNTETKFLSMVEMLGLFNRYVSSEATSGELRDMANFISNNLLAMFPEHGEDQLFQLSRKALDDNQARSLSEMILDLMKKLSDHKRTSWIGLIPLLHALKRIDANTQGSRMRAHSWWGTTGFHVLVENLKDCSRINVSALLAKLKPFFKDCVVLPYTFLALLNQKQLQEFVESIVNAEQLIPINGVLASASYHIAKATTHEMKLELYEAVCSFMKRMNSWQTVQRVDDNTIELAISFLDKFRTIERRALQSETSQLDQAHIAVNLYLLILEMYLAFNDVEDVGKLTDSLQAKLSSFMDEFKVDLAVASQEELKSEEVKKWKLMFQSTVINQRISRMLTSTFGSAFAERIEEITNRNRQHIIDLYRKESFGIPEMDDAVSRSAFSVADDLLTGDSYDRLSSERANPKIYKLIDRALADSWPRDHDGDTFHMVRNLIKGGEIVSVCKFVRDLSAEDKAKYLDCRNQERLALANSSFENVIAKLLDGSITFHQYDVLKSDKDNLIEFCEVSNHLRERCGEIARAIDKREDEVIQFDSFVQSLTAFWESCRMHFAVHQDIDEWLGRDPSKITFQQAFDPTTQEVLCDPIPPDLRPFLYPFSLLIRRPIFHGIFHTRLREAGDSWQAVIQAYHASLKQYNDTVESLAKGTITIRLIQELAADYLQRDVTKLIKELPEMIKDTTVCKGRQRQIEESSQIAQYSYSAEVLLLMKRECDLEGDFTALNQIAEVMTKDVELRSLDLTIFDKMPHIKKIGRLEADCLKAYIDCKDFVKWTKETVERKDISVFVDLASDALGEDDLSAQKTRYLLNALNGYIPLLYDLDLGPKDLQSFFTLCECMWSEVKTNPELPNFLRESARELEFFKRVKSHFGNVEIATMAQATAINETGVYYIGNIHGFTKEFQTVDNVIRLKWLRKDEHGGTEKELYSYEDIKELQGKLTLAAGDKQKDNMETIQEFDTMRDAVENLAKAYIDIRKEGCIQFDDLLVIVHCNPGGEVAVEIDLQSIGKKIFGLKSHRTALQHCHDVYEYLRESTKAWRQSMDQKRSEIAELNYYTTEQLVMMRRELGKFLYDRQQGTSGCLDKAMPLLAMVHAIRPDDLFATMSEFEEGKPDATENPVAGYVDYHDMTNDQQDKIADVGDLFGLTEKLAIQAVNELGFDKRDDEYLTWNEDRLRGLSKAAELKRRENERTTDDVMRLIIEQQQQQQQQVDLIDSSLMKKLKTLWDQFIAHTSKSIKNFLGIPQLGHVLRKLEALKPQSGTRNLPNWLQRGTPALIAVPKSKTYSMVLSIYEADKAAPPPTRSEVLVCSKQTRTEEAVLFLNRALQDCSSFYCMVNCHLINYEVSRIIEQRLSNLADENELKFGLAFIYAQEVNHPRIRAHLHKYQIKNPQITNSTQLKDFVAQLLTIDGNTPHTVLNVELDRYMCRLIRSDVSGVGKSLLKSNRCNYLRQTAKLPGEDVTIPIYKTIDADSIIKRLLQDPGNVYFEEVYHTIHLDIAYEVETGVDELLFNLIILRSVVNTEGMVWQARDSQYYIIECMPHMTEHGCAHEVVDLLPTTMCHTPDEIYSAYKDKVAINGFDCGVLQKIEWQTVLKYLDAYKNKRCTYEIDTEPAITSEEQALQLLLENCGLNNPTWAELRHYVHFLYSQLKKVATSPFCQDYNASSLRGFKKFVVEFMLKMARDFATRSLVITEEGQRVKQQRERLQATDELENVAIRKKWEDSNHPYLFFNEDGESVTTLGFETKLDASSLESMMLTTGLTSPRHSYLHPAILSRKNCHLVDCETGQPFAGYDIPSTLVEDLARQKVTVSENFNNLRRPDQLERLRKIMVNNVPHCTYDSDPNENYVLTMDNAKKIIAIHQRLRVGIPVIIMGETGCGKTLLIEFMSKLQVPNELLSQLTQTMVTVKIHGGTSEDDIIGKVEEALALAKKNREICEAYANSFIQVQTDAANNQPVAACNLCDQANSGLTRMPCNHVICETCITSYTHASQHFKCLMCNKVPGVYTVLFLDEANTTEAIGLVKEILCDGRMNGKALDLSSGLKIIASCNPYRKHSAEMINKLQKAGLGYSVDAADSSEKFGKIPLRHLVYRVHALPQSLLPLVWDFGTLKSAPYSEDGELLNVGDVEKTYIVEMIHKFEKSNTVALALNFASRQLIAAILSRSQAFMRNQKDECSFVSLRDIQRLLDVFAWFYQQREILYPKMLMLARVNPNQPRIQLDDVAMSFLLAIGVCYVARLEEDTRIEYAEYIKRDIKALVGEMQPMNGRDILFHQIELCQQLFVNEVVDTDQHENICKNKALRENVFMLIVCIENRIPLFIIGKPGSSKSLSKSIVLDSMKGSRSKNHLFKQLKSTHMVSFQCSKHASTDGIIRVFAHCAKFQKGQDLTKFVSVVVLDEVGLADDSENFPLKALHPLLEDGCTSDTSPEPYMKCAFIGISNWALDPAKMNRGIFVQRGSLDKDELLKIAREICGLSELGNTGAEAFFKPLADGFLAICDSKKPVDRINTEFFGLRDYYSVVKMVANFAKEMGHLYQNQLIHSIKRNFGGFDPIEFDPMRIFEQHCRQALKGLKDGGESGPPTDSIKLIDSCLSGVHTQGIESRYLLILTENLSVLTIIQDMLSKHDVKPEVVFGSKFPDDVSYTQVCHNIFRIKTCMDLGKPVILLNLDDLYESLYDALNQYFSKWGDKKFVDIGLGTHRVKAFVNDGFRLIVIAEKVKVYKHFPIPLINRLEKHYVSATSMLKPVELRVKQKLEEWMQQFAMPDKALRNSCPFECEGCTTHLSLPYKLSCGHYIGNCCRDKIALGELDEVCPVKDCDVRIDEDYEWRECNQELLNRQYFENSSTTSAFIGYSSELTALAIRKADNEKDSAGIYEELFEKAKFYLLQCATGESVLRLDKTMLKAESANLQKIYLEVQKHETLLQYLEHELPRAGETPLFMQVTSFSQLMGRTDVEDLHRMLNLEDRLTDTRSLYLKDFVRESQFTENIRRFYWQKSAFRSKLMIVQCEAEDENTELLDVVRYIIQREASEAVVLDEELTREASYVPNHTVLLLSLPRGHSFTGYQGGVWKCMQVDDPRAPMFQLPTLNECLQLKPSGIIGRLLGCLDSLGADMDSGPPPLEGDSDAEDTQVLPGEEEEYPDNELQEANNRAGVETRCSLNLILPFIKHCLPIAMSIIASSRPDGRLRILMDLLDGQEPEFLKTFLERVHELLTEQDTYLPPRFNWVKEDAVRASNMRTSETLRHAVEDAFERAIVPSLAAVISFIDVQHNLSLLKGDAAFKDLWLQMFEVTDKLGLSFDDMVVAGQSKLPRAYKIQDAGRNMSNFNVRFPFSWIVMESIERLQMAFEDVSLGSKLADTDQIETRQLRFFKETPQGKVMTKFMNAENSKHLIDSYLHDFVFMAYPCRSETEHWIVQSTIRKVLQFRYEDDEISVVHVHLIFNELREMMKNLTDILSIDLVIEGNLSSIAEQVKEKMEQEDTNVATFEPCDLVAVNNCLTILASTRIKKLQENPQEWIDQMDQTAAVVTVILSSPSNHDEDQAMTQQCRKLWLQLEVKKLYTEHVILPSIPGPGNKRNSFKLNDLIQCTKDADFQSNETFQNVVVFLKDRVSDGLRTLYPKCPRLCPMCEENLDSPVKLLCGHLICDSCTRHNEMCATEGCGARIPVGYEYIPSEGSVEVQDLLTFKDLRKRLNNFFMPFVSKMVFSADGTAPDEAVINWLINRIHSETGTRAFAFYNSKEAVDSTPVLRSFLLKLFLCCEQNETIILCLDQMMEMWGAEDVENQLSTMNMIIDCHKGIFEHVGNLEWGQSIGSLMKSLDELFAEDVRKLTVHSLTAITEIQCHICNVVERFLFKQSQQPLDEMEERLEEFFRQTCNRGNREPMYFVVRHLLLREGETYIKDLLNTPRSYLIPADIQDVLLRFPVPDILSIYGGKEYEASLRDLRAVVAQSGEIGAINQFCQNTEGCIILEAIFTGVTRTFAENVPVPDEVRLSLLDKLTTSDRTSQGMCQILLNPDRIPEGMDVNSAQGLNLFMLILHLLSATHQRTGDINPLAEIVNSPEHAAERLMPTMEDNQIDVQREAQNDHLEEATQYGNESIMYYCPNGHPYLIGSCGRPWFKAKCLCGADIGGTDLHVSARGNVRSGNQQQLTKSGHTLGSPETRIQVAQPERELSALSCAVLRCLTHLAMYTSALISPEQVMAMIEPRLTNPDNLEQFLHTHIKKDLQLISSCCNMSTDDCVLLLHDIIANITIRWEDETGEAINLATIKERRNWEAYFDAKYMKPTLENKADVVSNIKERIASSSPVSSLDEILDVNVNPINKENLLASAGLWNYRRPLNLAVIQNEIQTQDCPILKLFADRCYQLIAIRCLPDIMALTQLLPEKFHSKFSREDAMQMNADEFCRNYDNPPVLGLRGKMKQFVKAWNIMVHTINSGAVAQVNLEKLPDNPPLAEFLFDIYSLNRNDQSNRASIGAAPFILATFLVDRHNDMLSIDMRERSTINLPKVISTNLVSISSEDEILDLVQSHCEYALGDTSAVTYDWAAIDRELDMRYIGSKPRILLTRSHLPSYMYQEDFSLLNQLKAIGGSQERLRPELEVSITNSLIINVQTLTDHLKELRVIINFLSAMSHIEKENSLAVFVKATLGNDREVTYLAAEVKLKHVRHVWFVLKYTQATRLKEQRQEPFDDVEPSYREELSGELIARLKECCLYNSPRTKFLLQMLFEFIILRLNRAVTADVGECEGIDKPLFTTLKGYIYGEDDQSLLERLGDLPELPEDLRVGHSASAWCHIWRMFTTHVAAANEIVME